MSEEIDSFKPLEAGDRVTFITDGTIERREANGVLVIKAFGHLFRKSEDEVSRSLFGAGDKPTEIQVGEPKPTAPKQPLSESQGLALLGMLGYMETHIQAFGSTVGMLQTAMLFQNQKEAARLNEELGKHLVEVISCCVNMLVLSNISEDAVRDIYHEAEKHKSTIVQAFDQGKDKAS